MKKYSLIAALLLTGCLDYRQEFPLTFQVSDRFSEKEIEVIKQSVSEWETATDGVVRVDLDFGFPYGFDYDRDYHPSTDRKAIYRLTNAEWSEVCRHEYDSDDSEFCTSIGITARDAWGPATTIVVKGVALDDLTTFHKIMLHEFGHFWGLTGHSDNIKSLMYPTITDTECIDTETLGKFCDLYECSDNVKGCPL